MSTSHHAAVFFLQMFVILAACRGVGWAARRLGQPQVVGEMIAGVLLGPSLLGLLWPAAQQRLFPADSLATLYVGAQLGVGLYMFLVGLEFDAAHFRRRARSAVAVSLAGMLAPFGLGSLLALWLVGVPGLFAPGIRTLEAMLFLGAAIAITAFPMLARIIHERGMSGSAVGTLALAAGAIDDAAAWCLLAVVLASAGGSAAAAALAIGGALVYGTAMIACGRRWLAPLGRLAEREQRLGNALLAAVLMLVMLAAWAMDTIGIHAVFGGFLLGTAMPRGLFAEELRRKLEPFAVVFLLPMFFTFSGLSTRLDTVDSPTMVLVALAVLVASVAGKGVACWAAARLSGESHRTALAVGTLMNARGLMELIILNIALQRGIIQPALFSVLVLMAAVTTLMTSPLFERIYGKAARLRGELGALPAAD